MRLAIVTTTLIVLCSSVPPAHAGQQRSAPPDPARLVAAAKDALSAGRAADAVASADAALALSPVNRDAAEIKIAALSSLGDARRAREAYSGFVTHTGAEDALLLRAVALADLRATAADVQADAPLRIAALARLAKNGDKGAQDELRRLAEQSAGGITLVLANAALAELGDRTAPLRLAELASSDRIRDKGWIADALRSANAKDQAYVLVPLLHDEDPFTRVRAADALGRLGHEAAIPELRALLSDERPSVRATAALALKRLGDDSGDELVTAMANSQVASTRLEALEASRSAKPADRAAAIKLLAADRDPLGRVRAAELIARDDPASARAALAPLAEQGDIAVRRDAVRVLETLAPADLALLHRLLGDANAWIRMHAASGVLNATRGK
jgi:hypothetical protein